MITLVSSLYCSKWKWWSSNQGLSISWLRLGISCPNANVTIAQLSDLTTTIVLAHLFKPSNLPKDTLTVSPPTIAKANSPANKEEGGSGCPS